MSCEDDHFRFACAGGCARSVTSAQIYPAGVRRACQLALKTWSVKLGAIGALVGVWAQSFPDAALHAWAVLPPDIKNILPPNIVALISPALVVLAVLSQYVRQPALKEKADELKEQQ